MSDHPTPLEPGRDFYFNEDGLMVLTAHFLKARGYCCKNACTNCPYGFTTANNGANKPRHASAPGEKTKQTTEKTASKCCVKN